MNIDEVIRARRTNMFVHKDRELPDDVVTELCTLATWAPNHKRTWPWRFASLTGDARARLGETVATAMAAHGDEPSKVEKARTKYLRTPNVLVIGSVVGDSPERTGENRDAVAAAVQNLMLAATSRSIATYWGTCARGAHDAVAELVGFEPETHIVGILYLGFQADDVAVPERPAPIINRLD